VEAETAHSKSETHVEWWRLIPLHIGDSAYHVALSDALVRYAAGQRPTVWWHMTERPTLLVGPASWSIQESLARRENSTEQNVAVVRRASGGGAVLAAAGVIGLDVALPAHHWLLSGDIVEDYRWLGHVWQRALRSLGIEARVLSIAEARMLSRAPINDEIEGYVRLACFGSYSPYEVVVGKRKVVGLSQVRRGGGVLLASGIHLHFDAATIVSALPVPHAYHADIASVLTQRAIGLEEAAGYALSVDDVMASFQRALAAEVDVQLNKGTWTRAELAHAHALYEDVYKTPS
jgi:lipoate-protein ligase A